MVNLPMHWRGDVALMERICPHGVGHPDPDDLEFHRTRGRAYLAIHECCAEGCCQVSKDEVYDEFVQMDEGPLP
jgi:hypothetical protein